MMTKSKLCPHFTWHISSIRRLLPPPHTIQRITLQISSFDSLANSSQYPFSSFSYVQPLNAAVQQGLVLGLLSFICIFSFGDFIHSTDNSPNIWSSAQTFPVTTIVYILIAHSTFLPQYWLGTSNFTQCSINSEKHLFLLLVYILTFLKLGCTF